MSFIQKVTKNAGSLLLVAAIAFGGGLIIGSYNKSEAEVTYSFWGDLEEIQPEGVDFGAFYKAWRILDERFVERTATSTEITDEDKLYGAIEGLAKAYGDPYTVFLPPSDNKLFAEDISGSFGGVGMEIGIRDETLTVIAPLKGTPAEAAGMRAGDKILAIDGESTQGYSVEDGVKEIRGEIGSEVVLTILRDGGTAPRDISIVRDNINIPTLDTVLREDGIFVIELYNFGATSPDLFRSAIREFSLSGSDKLILDLRGNPGGFLEASVDMASWFLPVGEVVVQEHFGGDSQPRMYRSKGYNVFDEDLEMVVLIDQGSASASEILAGALSEQGVATLVGMQTFGKGSVQELVDITDETSLKITIARWLTPLGHTISENGLTPDYEVEVTEESLEQNRDLQKERAVELLLRGF